MPPVIQTWRRQAAETSEQSA